MFELVGLGHSVIALLYLLLAIIQVGFVYLFKPLGKVENYVLASGLGSFFLGCGIHHLTMMRHGLSGHPIDFASLHHWVPTAMQVFGAVAVTYVVFPYVFEIVKLALLKYREDDDHHRRKNDKKIAQWIMPSAHAAGIRGALLGYLILVTFVFLGFQRIESSQRDLESLRVERQQDEAQITYDQCKNQETGFAGLRDSHEILFTILDGLLARENRSPNPLTPDQERRVVILEQGKQKLASDIRNLNKKIADLDCNQYLTP